MHVKCLQDDSTSLEDQDNMIENLRHGATDQREVKVAELESDHYPVICMPDRLIKAVVESVEGPGSS